MERKEITLFFVDGRIVTVLVKEDDIDFVTRLANEQATLDGCCVR